jgi:uncharacterized protein YqjF (DUF2071 family)
MLNYAIDPTLLAPLVPRGVELDFWEGEALVSLVGFRFLETRVLGFAVPFHRDFEEVNLRFYVRRRVGDEWRRGVTFIREFVPRRAIAWTAAALYHEPYRAVPMRHRQLAYEWRMRGRWHALGAEIEGEPRALPPGSPEEFIFEHYYGYTRQRDGGTVEYQVEHPRWRAWTAVRAWFEADVAACYGPAFVPALNAAPRSAFVAEGSPVVVRRAVRL